MSFTSPFPAPVNPTEDRRATARRRFDHLTYAEFGPDNGGILIDIAEGGARFQSVEPVTLGATLPVSFLLTGVLGAIKAAAKVVWCNDSGKGGGLQFIDLSDEARQKIAAWVSKGAAPAAPPSAAPGQDHQHEKFNLLSTEGYRAPEPTSDAAALAMARLLVSARGSSKRDSGPRANPEKDQNAPSPAGPRVIDPDAWPDALVAPEPAAPIWHAQPMATVPAEPVAAIPSSAASTQAPEEEAASEHIALDPVPGNIADMLEVAAEIPAVDESTPSPVQTSADSPPPAVIEVSAPLDATALEIAPDAATGEGPVAAELSAAQEPQAEPAAESPIEVVFEVEDVLAGAEGATTQHVPAEPPVTRETIAEPIHSETEPQPEPVAEIAAPIEALAPALSQVEAEAESSAVPALIASPSEASDASPLDASPEHPEAAPLEAMPQPAAEVPALEAAAINQDADAPDELTAAPIMEPSEVQLPPTAFVMGMEPAQPQQSVSEPVTTLEESTAASSEAEKVEALAIVQVPIAPAPVASQPTAFAEIKESRRKERESKRALRAAAREQSKKGKPIRPNPLGLPSILDPAPASATADAPPEGSVPYWAVQVLKFAVGVGVGCCLVAGTFVGIRLSDPAHRSFSLRPARPVAVEAAAPSAPQPLDVDVVDLSSQRWHLGDADADAAPAAPEEPVVELTPSEPATPPAKLAQPVAPIRTAAVVPPPAAAHASAPSPEKLQPARKPTPKVLAMRQPSVARKSAPAGDLRAPTIFDSSTPAIPSSLGNLGAHGPVRPSPVMPEAPNSVFPSLLPAPTTPRDSEFQAAVIVQQANPIYPPAAKQQHLSGIVRVNAIIGKDGVPRSLAVISGDPRLAPAALAAVAQWRYRPAQINGEAVESEATISVEFQP